MIKFLPIFLLSGIVLTGCDSLPKPHLRQDVASHLSVPKRFEQPVSDHSVLIKSLLDLFNDKVLEQLVQEALDNNLAILLAQFQSDEQKQNRLAAQRRLLPNISAAFQQTRSKDGLSQPQSQYRPTLNVSWEIDLWGKIADGVEIEKAQAAEQIEQLKALQDSIAAQVIQGWFDVVSRQQLIELERFRLKNLQRHADNHLLEYRAGLVALDDWMALQREVAQTQSTLIEKNSQYQLAVAHLQVLKGSYPDGKMAASYQLPALLPPPKIGLPVHLLINRPDLRAAWQKVLAENSSLKVTQKEMYPSLELTSQMGGSSDALSNLLSGATIWSLASQLTLPIFDAQKNQFRLAAAKSRSQQVWIEYLQQALTAFREVERALAQETLLAQQEIQQQLAVQHAIQTAEIFQQRYQHGLVSILEFLNAENSLYEMQSQLLNIQNARLKNRVGLALALGIGV